MKHWKLWIFICAVTVLTVALLGSFFWSQWFMNHPAALAFFTVLPILGIALVIILGHIRFHRR